MADGRLRFAENNKCKTTEVKEFITFIKQSFQEKGETSSKKLTAFIITAMIVLAHISWLKSAFMQSDFSLLSEILIIDFSFITACFGIKEWGSVLKNKQSNTTEQQLTQKQTQ